MASLFEFETSEFTSKSNEFRIHNSSSLKQAAELMIEGDIRADAPQFEAKGESIREKLGILGIDKTIFLNSEMMD